MDRIENKPHTQHYPIINEINCEKSKKIYDIIIEKIKKVTTQNTNESFIPESTTTTILKNEPNEEKNKNVGLVLWYQPVNGPVEILTGIETHYLTETFNPNLPHTQYLIQLLKNYEKINFPCSSNKVANQIFKERSTNLSKIFQIPISFESIPSPSLTNPFFIQYSQTQKAQYYETHYRIIKSPHQPKYGIIKGKVEKGEKPIQAILREMEEELKLPLNLITKDSLEYLPSKKIHRFQNSILYTYHKKLTEKEYIHLKEWMKDNNPEGEMMNFEFRPIYQVNNNKKTNAKTAEHIKTFRKNIIQLLYTSL
jgi:8-oxo-dGTP pyrophosphatase MutT (NUDIX family)